MDPTLLNTINQLVYTPKAPSLDGGAANLSAGAPPVDPVAMPIPDVSLRDWNAPLQAKNAQIGGGAGHGKNAKMDAILGLLGAGTDIASALLEKEPKGSSQYNPLESGSLGSAPILGGAQGATPLEKSGMQVMPYQSAISALLGHR